MKESKVIDENYFVIHGWMLNKLKLKGSKLQIFAIIYGFSQDGQSKFTGSLQYLADWTGTTKENCRLNLIALLEADLIEKEEIEINNNKFCKYNAKLDTIQKICIATQKSCINNIDNNIDNTNIINNICINNVEKEKNSNNDDKILNENIKYIIDYLNESIGSKYKYNNKTTIKLIKARFREGYNLDDFYDVIDKKVKDWFNTEMQKYLRPETLFGNKFENYLNQKAFTGKPKSSYSAKPTFDNTANHNVPKGIASMTKEEKEDFIENELAKDENGNFLKF